ncbi:unnamed protein product [Absidia cylindrospora]
MFTAMASGQHRMDGSAPDRMPTDLNELFAAAAAGGGSGGVGGGFPFNPALLASMTGAMPSGGDGSAAAGAGAAATSTVDPSLKYWNYSFDIYVDARNIRCLHGMGHGRNDKNGSVIERRGW